MVSIMGKGYNEIPGEERGERDFKIFQIVIYWSNILTSYRKLLTDFRLILKYIYTCSYIYIEYIQ